MKIIGPKNVNKIILFFEYLKNYLIMEDESTDTLSSASTRV